MLFKDLSLETIIRTIDDLRRSEKIYEDSLREKCKDFYEGRQTKPEYLMNWGFRNKNNKMNLPGVGYPITKKVIDKISLVYKKPPTREGGGGYADWFTMHPEFNIAMKQAERYKNLLSHVLYRPVFSMNKWRPFIETEYVAHFHEDDPLNPVAYSIPIKQDKNTKPGEERWVFWSDEFYFFHDNNGKKIYDENFPLGLNPYGIIPFIEMRESFPVDCYDTLPALPLIQANESINVAMMNLNYMIHYQAFDQMWAQGIDQDSAANIELGPNKIVFTPDQASLNLLGYSPKIIEVIDAIKFEMQAIGWGYNISIDWSIEGTVASGVALKIRNMDLLEAREDDIDIAKLQEQQLFQVIGTVQEFHRRTGEIKGSEPKIDINKQMLVNFDDVSFPLSWEEEEAQWRFEFDNNISTPVDYMQNKDPDLGEEEALERFRHNKEIQGKLSRADVFRTQLELINGSSENVIGRPNNPEQK